MSPAHHKGLLGSLFGWGRREEPSAEADPKDTVQPAAPPAPPVMTKPAAAPAPKVDPAQKADPSQKVALTPDVIAALTRTQPSGPLAQLWGNPVADVVGPGYPNELGSPVLSRDGSTAFFATERALLALDSRTGTNLWSYDAGGKGLRSGPLVSPDGRIVVSGGDGRIHALDPATRNAAWKADMPSAGGLDLGPDGSIVVYHGSGMTGLDPATGATRWTSKAGGGEMSAGLDGRMFAAGDGHRTLVAYDGDSGSEIWRFQHGGLIRHRPTVGPDGTVYVGDVNGNFYAVDPATGEPKWSMKADGYILFPSTLSGDGKTVYIGSSDHHLYALNTATGEERWKRDVGAEIRQQVTVTDEGTVVLASDRNVVFVINATTGGVMARADAASYVHCAPDSAGGVVVLRANNHSLYGFQAPLTSDLMVRRQAHAPAPDTADIAVGEAAVRIGDVELPIQR